MPKMFYYAHVPLYPALAEFYFEILAFPELDS